MMFNALLGTAKLDSWEFPQRQLNDGGQQQTNSFQANNTVLSKNDNIDWKFLDEPEPEEKSIAASKFFTSPNKELIVAISYLNKKRFSKNDGQAIKALNLVKNLAEQGIPEAEYELGFCYFSGKQNLLDKNLDEALKFFKSAAKKGFAPALHTLGLRYFNGDIVAKDVKEAGRLFQEAADLRHDKAAHMIGLFYLKGTDGRAIDRDEAERWFEKSAEMGCVNAMFQLGVLLSGNNSDEQQLKKAKHWFTLAAHAVERAGEMLRVVEDRLNRIEQIKSSAHGNVGREKTNIVSRQKTTGELIKEMRTRSELTIGGEQSVLDLNQKSDVNEEGKQEIEEMSVAHAQSLAQVHLYYQALLSQRDMQLLAQAQIIQGLQSELTKANTCIQSLALAQLQKR